MTDTLLDSRFTLQDLLDLGVLRDILEAYSQCFDLGITVVNIDGQEIIGAGPDQDFCKALEGTSMLKKCEDLKNRLYKYPIEDSRVLQTKSFCQMRYAIFPLTYQLDALGRVIIGPFHDPELSPDQVMGALGEPGKSPVTTDHIQKIPAFSQERLKIVIKLLSKIVNSFLFINAKRLITTRLHLDNIYTSREDIFRQVELQEFGSQEDKEEIKKLKDLF